MKKVSILFVANSFGDDTIMYMSRIAKEFGIELDAHILYIGGCDINTHIKNLINNSPKYEYRLVNEDYDNIITQYDYIANEAINNDWDYILKISTNFKIYSVPVILSKYYNHDGENRISNIPFEFKEYSAIDTAKISAGSRGIQGQIDTTDPKWRKTGYKESGGAAGLGFALGIQQRLQKATFELVDYLEQMYKNKGITHI